MQYKLFIYYRKKYVTTLLHTNIMQALYLTFKCRKNKSVKILFQYKNEFQVQGCGKTST